MALGAAYDRDTAHQGSSTQPGSDVEALFADGARLSRHQPSNSMHSDASSEAAPLSDVAQPYVASPRPSGEAPEAAAGPAHMFQKSSCSSSVDAAAASLRSRLSRLRGSEMLGSVLIDIAPIEAFVDTPALLGLLELGLALQTRVALGDAEFARCVSCAERDIRLHILAAVPTSGCG